MSLAADIYARLLCLESAGCDSVRLIELELRRIELGYANYGPLKLDQDKRDWKLERIEEWLDGRMYIAAEQAKREPHPDPTTDPASASECHAAGECIGVACSVIPGRKP